MSQMKIRITHKTNEGPGWLKFIHEDDGGDLAFMHKDVLEAKYANIRLGCPKCGEQTYLGLSVALNACDDILDKEGSVVIESAAYMPQRKDGE